MKFVCHNCGFSAEVPKAIATCPMCGSTNTGQEEDSEESAKTSPPVSFGTTPVSTGSVSRTPSEDIRNRNAALSEEFFSKKPYQEEQEIAELLQELGAEEQQKAKKRPFPFLPVVGGSIVAAVLMVLLYSLWWSQEPQSSENEAKELLGLQEGGKKEPEPGPKDVSTPVVVSGVGSDPAPAPGAKSEPAATPTSDAKPAPAPAPAPVPVSEVKPEPAPTPAPVPEAKQEPKSAPASEEKSVATPVAQPEPKTIGEKSSRPFSISPKSKPKPAAQVKEGLFDKLVAEGNAAVAAQRFNDAIHAYKDALKLNPNAGKIHKFLGIAYASIGNAAKACEHYRRYLAMVPDAADRAQVEQLTADCP